MSKRIVLMSVVAVVAFALGSTSVVWAKAHVPLGRVQICSSGGEARNITQRSMARLISGGACRLTACAFNDMDGDTVVKQFVFVAGDPCDNTDDNGDGFCDATGTPKSVPRRLRAINVTPACTDSV